MKNLETLYETVVDLAEEVPFGNSDWQNRQGIVNDEKTPCRAYRHAALRIMNRLEALRELRFNMRKRDVEIRILQRDLTNESDDLKREMIQIEIDQKRSADSYTRKLTKDAVREIESLWPVLAAMGKLTRAQFEAEEQQFYEKKHNLKLPASGDLYDAIKATALGHDKETIDLLGFADVKALIEQAES